MAKLGLLVNLGQKLLGFLFTALRCLKQSGILRLQRLNGILGSVQVKACVLQRLLCRIQLSAQLFGIVKPKTDVGFFLVFHQLNGTLGALGFLLQGTDTGRDLGKNVVDTLHVVLGILQLALRLVLFIAVFGNSRSILKGTAALLTFP